MKIVDIEWYDAFGYYYSDFYSLEEVKEKLEEGCTLRSVGYLIAENKRYYLICDTIDGETYRNLRGIPKKNVISIHTMWKDKEQ